MEEDSVDEVAPSAQLESEKIKQLFRIKYFMYTTTEHHYHVTFHLPTSMLEKTDVCKQQIDLKAFYTMKIQIKYNYRSGNYIMTILAYTVILK